MPSRRLTFPAVAALAIASLALGVVAALADGRDSGKRHAAVRVRPPQVVLAAPATRPVPPTAAIVVASGGDTFLRAAVPAAPCPVDDKPPAAAPVPQNLLDAFGVLRRDRADADELPAAALKALRQRGLEPFDPAAARLLRQADDGGRAWVVPVRDVRAGAGTVFELRCVIRTLSRQRRTLAQAMRARRRQAPRARPNVRRTPAAPTVPVPATPPAATEPAPAPTTPAPAPAATVPAAPNTTNKPAAHPGLAIVALGGAPAGAGGRLEDLVRGREEVALDPCGGPNHNMLSVSGIVLDGVGAAFLTSPDGTAVRADVKDNAYAFVIPRINRAEQRYVVWTGGDGTPHVQPLAAPVFLGRMRCATLTGDRPPIVSPNDSGLCGHFDRAPVIVLPATPVPSPRTPASRPPAVVYQPPCALASQVGRALPVPPTVRLLPKTRRAPKHHG
ncbi:hypothetical protein [Baekduia sp.]|jgi:hypothetical protein|uniref:hypothetical protein n=1 Tax=Baekduia sp. TaxID=2600305 RepID=UPI002E0CE092|nr:hypothetical protein [Baekduia sp.]